MAKYTFICEEEPIRIGEFDNSPKVKRLVEFHAETLDQLLPEFEMFLRGSGFYFRGTLDVVPYDDEIRDSNFDFTEIPKNNWPFSKEETENAN